MGLHKSFIVLLKVKRFISYMTSSVGYWERSEVLVVVCRWRRCAVS